MRQKPSSDYAEHHDPCLAGNAAFFVNEGCIACFHVKHCGHAILASSECKTSQQFHTAFFAFHMFSHVKHAALGSFVCRTCQQCHIQQISSNVVMQLLDHLCAKFVSDVIYSNLLRAPLIPKAIRPSQNVNRCCSIQLLQPIRLLWYIWPTNLCQVGVVCPLVHWHDVCLQQHVVLSTLDHGQITNTSVNDIVSITCSV